MLILGDCVEKMREMAAGSVDAIVTDPPYGLEFMGKDWDKLDGFRRSRNPADAGRDSVFGRTSRSCPEYGRGEAAEEWHIAWATEALRVLKPGGHLVAFGGTRTVHRLVCAVEDVGFEIRDMLMWIHGQGFPKSRNVGKEVPEFEGWGTALKPAQEPICLARKPLDGTVARNVLRHGVGGLNIGACRVAFLDDSDKASAVPGGRVTSQVGCFAGKSQDGFVIRGHVDDGEVLYWSNSMGWVSRESADVFHENDVRDPMGATGREPATKRTEREFSQPAGRFPANVIHDGSEEALAQFPDSGGQQGDLKETGRARPSKGKFGDMPPPAAHPRREEVDRCAARFFYCAKPSKAERGEGNTHPTVKPVALMRYLCRLVTPPGGLVLDPFLGSGTTGVAALAEGFRFLGIEQSPEYLQIARARLERNEQ